MIFLRFIWLRYRGSIRKASYRYRIRGSTVAIFVQPPRADLPDSVFVLDNPQTLNETLALARAQLGNAKPVVLVLVHHALAEASSENPLAPAVTISEALSIGSAVR